MSERGDGWDELIAEVDDAYAEEWVAEFGCQPFSRERVREIEWEWYAELGELRRERDEYRDGKRRPGR